MLCPNCQHSVTEDDTYCRQCGADLVEPSTSLVPLQKNLPSLLYNSPIPRSVAAGAGAVALGVGIELLRRGLLARLSQPSKSVENALPVLGGLKDLLLPQNNNKPFKLRRGYEVHETVIYMRRVIRPED